MTVEVVARRFTRSTTDGTPPIQRRPRLVPEPEPTLYRPLQREELINITTSDQLRPHLYALIDNRFRPDEAELGKRIYEIVVRQFKGEFRRNGSEAVVHPGGVAYWDLLNNPRISLVRFGIDLFHDNEEDLGLSPKNNFDLLRMADVPELDARLIALGAFALSRKENGRKLSHEEYNKKIVDINTFAEPLGLLEIKPIDTWFNVEDDINQLRKDPTNTELAKRADEYLLGKAAKVSDLAPKDKPLTTNMKLLHDAMGRCKQIVRNILTAQETTVRVPA